MNGRPEIETAPTDIRSGAHHGQITKRHGPAWSPVADSLFSVRDERPTGRATMPMSGRSDAGTAPGVPNEPYQLWPTTGG
jgi:hypothetical protein